MSIIPGISALKKRPRAGLLGVASPLPSGTDWHREISYTPEGCTAPDAIPVCGATEKPEAIVQEAMVIRPFGIVASDGCNDPWASNEEFVQRAERVLSMGESAILARELLQSTVSANPDLQGNAVNITPGGLPVVGDSGGNPVGWQEAATALIYNMVNAGYVGDIVMHAPSWLLPSFNTSQVGAIDPTTRRAYIGPHEVVFDAGYNGLIGPGGDPGLAAPNVAGWVYATGPVEYAFGDLIDDDALIAADNRQNTRYVVAERPGIVRFDICQVFGILVEVC